MLADSWFYSVSWVALSINLENSLSASSFWPMRRLHLIIEQMSPNGS